MGEPSNIYPLELDSSADAWWTVRLRGLSFGGSNILSSSTKRAIIDSGTSFIAISEADFRQFAKKVLELDGMVCDYSRGCYSPEGKWCDEYTPLLADLSI